MTSSISDNLLGFPQYGGIQRAYTWDLILPDLYGIIVSGVVVSRYCQSVKFGQYNITSVSEFRVGPFRRFYPEEINIETVGMTFVAPTPDLISLYFAKWKSLILDKLGRHSLPSVYKKTAYIIFYSRMMIPIKSVKLVGMFPITYPAFNLDYTTEEAVKFNIEFRCDYVETNFDAFSSLISGVSDVVSAIGK